MYIKAIHTIQRDPKDTPPVIHAGAVGELHGTELESMLAANAAVEATEADLVKAGIIPEAADKAAAEQAERDAVELAAMEAADKAAAEKEASDKTAADKKGKGKKAAADDESLV
ncbi:hypothetical protein [Mesorhizobium sp. INR15]|uniref:hypothetical protein n=1 Tax=Mesorhizobium sp. INR15 TaxID=2654248 RepID=UPI0018965805|nr:hypothetical protein [Mesorhizobium sp. INR15]QPC91444.1 hypothetical protein GA829_12955 [Mesorhizobium sp. INR15]